MARFSCDCLYKMTELVKELEVILGPDTTELGMRFGLHSGPVTAGVLRGERARFQLFGDTVNTTSRIETTGQRDRIHVSQETADLLIAAGKGHWIVPREDKVTAKGKGELTTFWLKVAGAATGASSSITNSNASEQEERAVVEEALEQEEKAASKPSKVLNEKQERLVHWNTEVLSKLLRDVKLRRALIKQQQDGNDDDDDNPSEDLSHLENATTTRSLGGVLGEVQEIITLPSFDPSVHAANAPSNEHVEVTDEEFGQLREYIHTIATLYNDNPFHNFEHASHVTMSVVKLLSRLVAPEITCRGTREDMAGTLHDHTYGITSDPLTQFAVVLAALIHDVDHPGVPNAQLVKEKTELAELYQNKSIAEQNSVDLAWELLMEPGFQALRQAIYRTESEWKRFRQLVVNAVMATDIMDQDLAALRKDRWIKAFSETVEDDPSTAVNRKATIVLEHLIQASDVAHTMQHWHIYRKWNGRFFAEVYQAYDEGRCGTNPADHWYEGEMGFFDSYVIPLAKKLKECGVFGVSSDEYLNYALQNRKEWERSGPAVVQSLLEHATRHHKLRGAGPEMSLLRRAGARNLGQQECDD